VGLVIDHEVIPVLPECTRLADEFGLDPLGCIASGSLLIVAAPEKSAAICEALAEAGVLARCIGRVVAKSEGVTMRVGGEQRSLPQFARDEIARLFE
jgi:hydrogenase maturation factor